jgi:hypothetical protein
MNVDVIELKQKVSSLEAALLSRHPTMPSLLSTIHKALRAQPENVTLLDEQELNVLFRGLEQQTNTFLAESVAKNSKKPGSVAALKAKGEDAF